MRKVVTPISLAFLLIAATIAPFVPIDKAYSLLSETETFTIAVQKDSFLKQGSQAHNEGINNILDIKSSDKHRPVIAFDTNAINSTVNGRPLQSAILRLYVTENGNNWSPSGNTIGAHRLLSDWNEGNGWNLGNNIAGTGTGVTWGCAIDDDISNNQNDCATQWNGGSFQSPATGNTLITNNVVNQWVEFNVTSDIQAFLNGTTDNYGWLIKKTSESMNGSVEFASKEAGSNYPELQITVINPEALLANEYLILVDELDNVGRTLNQTEITQPLVDDINSDLARIEEIVIALQNLGFDGQANATQIGPQMIGTVKFYDKETSETLFETQIPDGTLGIFAAMGMKEQFVEQNMLITFDQLSDLLASSFSLAQAMTTFEDDEIASSFVLASIAAFHTSTGNTFFIGLSVAVIILTVINWCLNNAACNAFVMQKIDEARIETYDFLYPHITVRGVKFDDKDGDRIKDDDISEPGIANWSFTIHTTRGLAPFQPSLDFFGVSTNATGHFIFNDVQVPRFIDNVVIVEEEKTGWVATSNSGLEEIPFTIPFNPDPVIFGNFKLGEISGFKYNDANGSGTRDDGEEGLSGWTILLKNATSGATINSTTTDGSGLYHFTGLVAGSYRVEEVQQQGYTQTAPQDGFHLVNIQSGTFVIGEDFGNRITPVLGPNVIGNSGFESGGLTVDAREPRGQWGSAGTRFGGNAIITTEDKHSGTHSLKITSATSKAAYVYQYYSLGGTTYSYSLWYKGSGDATAEVTTGWGPPPWFLGGPLNAKVGAAMSLGRGLLPMDGQWHKTTVVNTPSAQALFLDGNQIACGSGNSILPTETLIGDLSTNAENTIVLYVDDVSLATGQEYPVSCPSAPTPPGGPYHYVELNQTSANVTRPGSVTIEVEVEWYDPAWPAQPVELTIANMTGTNITYTTENLYNTTEYQKFEITFNVTVDVQLGEYFIPIVARDLEDGYIEQDIFLLRVE